MKQWEDIVREKMASVSPGVPESALAEFRARRAAATPSGRRVSPLWALVPVLVAASAVLIYWALPIQPRGEIRLPEQPLALAADTTLAAPTALSDNTAAADGPAASVDHSAATAWLESAVETTHQSGSDHGAAPVVSTEDNDATGPQIPPQTEEARADTLSTGRVPDASPYLPERYGRSRPAPVKVSTAMGVIAGGGLLAAVATPFLGALTSSGRVNRAQTDAGASSTWMPGEDIIEACNYALPLKGGLSIGIPVGSRLRITTGLDYTLYYSRFTYTISGEKQQFAHFLGIPLRLDWIWAENRWLQAYLGGGIHGDICLGATLGGERLQPDSPGFSLLAAGGLQYNFTPRVGLFVEPEISCTIPSEGHTLNTCRSTFPLMFTLSAGLRLNLGKKPQG